MAPGTRRLVLLLTQLGDFDSMEYAQALVPVLPQRERAGINIRAIAIGDTAGAERFCAYTGFPRQALEVMRSRCCTGSSGSRKGSRLRAALGQVCC